MSYSSRSQAFKEWERHYPATVLLSEPADISIVAELLSWLESNCGPRAEHFMDGEGKWVYWSNSKFLFKHEKDAEWFALRWS